MADLTAMRRSFGKAMLPISPYDRWAVWMPNGKRGTTVAIFCTGCVVNSSSPYTLAPDITLIVDAKDEQISKWDGR